MPQQTFSFFCLAFFLIEAICHENGQGARGDDHHAGVRHEGRQQHEQDTHEDERVHRDVHVSPEVLVCHGAEQSRDDGVEGRLQRRGLEDGLQGNEQRHTQRQHEDGHQRSGGDGQRGDDLILLGAALGADEVLGVHRAGNLHVDEVAGDEREVRTARSQHRCVDEVLRNARDHPDDADGQEALGDRAEVRHGAEVPADGEGRPEEQCQRHDADDPPEEVCGLIVFFKVSLILVFHVVTSLQFSEEDGRDHSHEHTARNGEVVDPVHLLFLFEPEEPGHGEGGDRDHRQGQPGPAEGEETSVRNEVAEVAADVRRDETDEHGSHGHVAKTRDAGLLPAFRRLAAAELLRVLLCKERREDHAPHDADAHEQGDGAEGLRRHGGTGQVADADGLGRRVRDRRLVVERADDREAQPGPGRPETAREGDDAEEDAHAGQHREGRARGDGPFHLGLIHADGEARPVRAYEEQDTDQRHEQDDPSADEVQDRTVEL